MTLNVLIKRKLHGRMHNDSTIRESLKKRRTQVNPYCDDTSHIRFKLKKRKQIDTTLDLSKINSNYRVLIVDDTIQSPFGMPVNAANFLKKEVIQLSTLQEKARSIFDWMQNNIDYGKSMRTNGYKNAEEVMRDREGVCGEMAYLYVVMARTVGLTSHYTSVKVDCFGRNVKHACAWVDLEPGDLFIDPAYHTYDVKHKEVKVLLDGEASHWYEEWRGSV